MVDVHYSVWSIQWPIQPFLEKKFKPDRRYFFQNKIFSKGHGDFGIG
jgi:hypothetical protein